MAFQINSQYTKFVQFAEQQVQAGNKTAIARLAGDPLADRTITTATGDKVAPFWGRSQANKAANNDVRTLFRNTIINMFAAEAKDPSLAPAIQKARATSLPARPTRKASRRCFRVAWTNI